MKDGAFELALGREPAIRSASGEGSLVLDELFPWFITLEALRPILGGVKNMTGAADMRLTRLSGRLAQPAALEYEAKIQPRQLRIEGPAFGASLVVVPVEIKGRVSDPQVRVLHAAAIGATLVNLMAATFRLPIDLLDVSRARAEPKP